MQPTSEDAKIMHRALRYALKGRCKVEPNPVVGCIITKGNQIIGKGWHRIFGGPHAEIIALEDCENMGVKPAGATMYVTLEPCFHHGKTPPCVDAIIKAGISTIFIATKDPSEKVNGQSVKKLKEAGIDVHLGLCETEAKITNAAFIKHSTTAKAWTILKWAQSIDGKFAHIDPQQNRWISSEQSLADAQALRRESGAIMVSAATVQADNPRLVPRPAKGKSPLRVVLDSSLQIPLSSRLLNTKSPTLIITTERSLTENSERAERIKGKDVEIAAVPEKDGHCDLDAAAKILGSRGIQQVLVETGPRLLNAFLAENAADEICAYIAGSILGATGNASMDQPLQKLQNSITLKHVKVKQLGSDAKITALIREP